MKTSLKHCLLFITCHLFFIAAALAGGISGQVVNPLAQPIASASIYVKGSTKGTTANNEGKFFLDLEPGKYTIVCTSVGFSRQEQQVTVTKDDIETMAFLLQPQATQLRDVVVKSNAEDPAYAIIRKAIKARKDHLNEVKQWQVDVYIKGLIKTVAIPKKIFGVSVDMDKNVVDSNGKGIIYLSESLTRYSRSLPDDYKEEVVSAKVSGNSRGFGFNSPNTMDFNLYENNISLEGLSSRGFVSPIADGALNFYRYRFDGTFYEDGIEINRILLIPKRKFEPTFAGGYINIIEGSWRIHSVDLYLDKESQLQLVDSLRIKQQLLPVDKKVWMPQQTSFFASFGIFGFKANASFMASYSTYDINKKLDKKFFGNVIKTIDTSANKKTMAYWDTIRPVPLTDEEMLDYVKKDTLEQKMRDPRYLDSMDRRRNRVGFGGIVLTGESFIKRKNKMIYRLQPLTETVQYNTVEGAVINFQPVIRHYGDTGSWTISPSIRYGFNNGHLNAMLGVTKSIGKNYRKRVTLGLSGGKYVYQINPANPIPFLGNTISTLLYKRNLMKIYENAFGRVTLNHTTQNGFRLGFGVSYEDRFPLENSDTSFVFFKKKRFPNRRFTSNYPEEVAPGNFERHQAFITSFRVSWQPGQKFIQYPNRRFSVGSDQPTFTLQYVRAWQGVFGSDASFDKWRLSMVDDFNMKLGGSVKYNLNIGGFITSKYVQLPDWQHFAGNRILAAGPYVQTFQLATYYGNSNKEKFWSSGHLEYHLNGLLTNKIPLFRRTNINLVTGSNAFYADKKKYYAEVFVGLENILKTIRVDFVWGYEAGISKPRSGVVIGFSGLFTGEGVE